jgi:hypothetical protein
MKADFKRRCKPGSTADWSEMDDDDKEAFYDGHERSTNRKESEGQEALRSSTGAQPTHLQTHGKIGNILSGIEQKIPRHILEDRHSSRMKGVRGSGYNEADWRDRESSKDNGIVTNECKKKDRVMPIGGSYIPSGALSRRTRSSTASERALRAISTIPRLDQVTKLSIILITLQSALLDLVQ